MTHSEIIKETRRKVDLWGMRITKPRISGGNFIKIYSDDRYELERMQQAIGFDSTKIRNGGGLIWASNRVKSEPEHYHLKFGKFSLAVLPIWD